MQLGNGVYTDVAHVQEVSVHCLFVLDELEMHMNTACQLQVALVVITCQGSVHQPSVRLR